MTANFMPNVWEPALLEQLKKSLLVRVPVSESDTPRPPRERYTLVHEGSFLHGAIMEDVDMFVPYEEAGEATQVMVDALNEWITVKKRNELKDPRN